MKLELKDLELPLAHFPLQLSEVLEGRVTGLFGASGSGKTTVLEVIAGLRMPRAGSVVMDGEVLTQTQGRQLVPPQHRGIGYVPQDGALFPHLSVEANLLFGYKPSAQQTPSLTPEHIAAVLELENLRSRRISTLSGGEQQRVALGRALLSAPRLLLLDEPLAGLDRSLKGRLVAHLRQVRDEFRVPMIYVTHAAEEVIELCDHVLVLRAGSVVRRGAPSEVFERIDTPTYGVRGGIA